MKVYDLNIALSEPEAVTELYLSNRKFEVFPVRILEMKNLTVLDLSSCNLTQIPEEIANLKKLHTLILNNNRIPGLPDSIASLSFRVVSLETNALTAIPEVLFQLSQLRDLSLAGNFLRELPAQLFNLKYLEKLTVSNNQIGVLPEEIRKLKALRQLKVGNNPLTKLPPQLFHCQRLEELALNNNRLTKLPGGIGQLSALENLDLSNNELAALPVEIGHCHQLRRLNLRRNKLTKLPELDQTFKYLIQFDASNNYLTRLPNWIQQCTRIEAMNLAENRFRSLPTFLSELPRLTKLDVSDNILRKWPALPDSLTTLNLNNNPITSIPADIGRLTRLEALHLDRTKLKKLPDQFKYLQALETLSAQGVLLKTLPKALLSLHQIRRLEGLLEYPLAILIRELWEMARERPISANLLKPVYDVLSEKQLALSKVSVQGLFSILDHEELVFFIREELFRRSQGKPDQALRAGKVLYCAGIPLFDLSELPARVEKQGIEYATRPNPKITHVLLGQAPEFHPALAKRNLIFINERELTRFLDQAEQRHLVVDPAPEVLENLRQLLLHKDPVNVEIALRMMQAGGVPEPLYNELLAILLARRPEFRGNLHTLARDLLSLNLSERDRQLLGIRRRMFFLKEPSESQPGETVTAMENLLRNSAFDASRILQIFKEHFGR